MTDRTRTSRNRIAQDLNYDRHVVEAPGRTKTLLDLRLPAERDSVADARLAAAEIARDVGAEEMDVKLAVSEAVANAVVHAFRQRAPGTIRLRADRTDVALVISVADDGGGMRPNLDSPGLGFGISLITKVAKDVTFDSSDRGTTVLMSFEAAEAGR